MNKISKSNRRGPDAFAQSRPEDETVAELRPVDILRKLRRGLPIIAACFVAAVVLTVVLVSLATPRYVASAQMLLGEQGLSDRSTFDLVQSTSLTNSVIEGELAVLKSNALLVRVARRLELNTVPEFNPALRPDEGPSLAARAIAFLKSLRGTEEVPVTDPDAPLGGIALAAGTGTQILGEYKDIVGKLRQNISVNQLGASYVVQVRSEAEDPQIASAITNALMQEYISFLSDKRFETARRFTTWLEARVADLAVRLEKSERDVFEFRARVEADSESRDRLDQQMRELTTRLGDQRSALAEAEAMHSEILATMERDGPLAAANLMSSEGIILLRAELVALRKRAAAAVISFGEDSPQVTSIDRSAAPIEDSIEFEVQREISRLSNHQEVLKIVIASLEERLVQVSRRILDQSGQEIELNQLTRVAEANQEVYQQFLGRFKELSEIQNLQVPDADVISYANPPVAPEFPRKSLSVAMAGFGGIAAGVLIVFLMDLAPKRVQTSAQMAALSDLPVYGQMPKPRPGATPLLRDADMEQAALRLVSDADLQSGGMARSLAFCGPLAGPEKSGAALMFGWAEARKGRRCLLVDADLREATLTGLLSPPEDMGNLVRLLYGESDLPGSVIRLDAFGIDVMPTSRMGSDPAVVFDTERFSLLMSAMLDSYDVVIFDAPASGDRFDAFRPQDRVDLGLIVLRAGAHLPGELRAAIASARGTHARHLGLVTIGAA